MLIHAILNLLTKSLMNLINSIAMIFLTLCLSFEERARCLDQVMQQHVEQTMFEDFAADVYAPVLPPNSASMYGLTLLYPDANYLSRIVR